MAQTKRKRQTKHRGNAAGVVESRGRTGRRPAAATDRRSASSPAGRDKAKARAQGLTRYDRPPTWRGAFYRAMAAAVLMLLVSLFLLKKPNQAIMIFPIVLGLYVPISYYTDMAMYRRRQRRKARRPAKG